MSTAERVASISATNGKVYVKRITGQLAAAYIGLPVYLGDHVITLSESYADLAFAIGGQVAMNENVILRVDGVRQVTDVTERTLAEKLLIGIGEVWAKVTLQQEEVQFETKGGILGMKG